MKQYFTNLDFLEIRGFPLLFTTFWGVFGRANLTSHIGSVSKKKRCQFRAETYTPPHPPRMPVTNGGLGWDSLQKNMLLLGLLSPHYTPENSHGLNPQKIGGFVYIQVEPGKPGAEVSKKKNYKSKKEFAYRMCARRPTSAMPKPFLCCEPAFCCSMVVM